MEVGVRIATTMGVLSDDVRKLFSSLAPGWRDEDFEQTPGGYECRLRELRIRVHHGGISLLLRAPERPPEPALCALL